MAGGFILEGRNTLYLLECFTKVGDIGIPHHIGYIVNLILRVEQQFLGKLYAVPENVVRKGLVHFRGEYAAQIAGRDVQAHRRFRQRSGRKTLIDILHSLRHQPDTMEVYFVSDSVGIALNGAQYRVINGIQRALFRYLCFCRRQQAVLLFRRRGCLRLALPAATYTLASRLAGFIGTPQMRCTCI